MQVNLLNDCDKNLKVAIARYEPDFCKSFTCRNDCWLVEGWWTIKPGEKVNAFSTSFTVFYYFAEDIEEAGYIWNDRYFFAPVSDAQKFSHCISAAPPFSKKVGMKVHDAGILYADYTLVLVMNHKTGELTGGSMSHGKIITNEIEQV